MTWTRPKRFWRETRVEATGDGYSIRLDERSLNTPGQVELVLPRRALADALAAEWDRIDDEIVPDLLPLTRAVNTAIDRVAPDPGAVAFDIAAYGENDLVCYRAEEPAELVRRQNAGWNPWLDWSAGTLAAPLVAVTGVMHHPQPARSVAALRDRVAAYDPFTLTGLHELVSLSGSLILGLAVCRGVLAPDVAWHLSQIDEEYQAEVWGRDGEAERAAAAKRAAFLQATRYLSLLEPEVPAP